MLRILGAAVNQDGRSSTFTAPYGPSQQALVLQTLGEARCGAEEVRYLSTHGTGTSLGDPIELAAAGQGGPHNGYPPSSTSAKLRLNVG